MPTTTAVRTARFTELTVRDLYALLRLRVDVFVVEQNCPYPELDGRDTEPGALHLWLDDADGPVAYLRTLDEPDGRARIGRVCVAARARGAGHARRLMAAALERLAGRDCELSAQAHLVDFYAGFGFAPTGPRYLEDGIPHVPMYRPASPREDGTAR